MFLHLETAHESRRQIDTSFFGTLPCSYDLVWHVSYYVGIHSNKLFLYPENCRGYIRIFYMARVTRLFVLYFSSYVSVACFQPRFCGHFKLLIMFA